MLRIANDVVYLPQIHFSSLEVWWVLRSVWLRFPGTYTTDGIDVPQTVTAPSEYARTCMGVNIYWGGRRRATMINISGLSYGASTLRKRICQECYSRAYRRFTYYFHDVTSHVSHMNPCLLIK